MAWPPNHAGRYTSPRWRALRAMVLDRDHHECQLRYPGICAGRAEQADHVLGKADGGSDHLDNLRAVCPPCHRHRTAQQGGHASRARWKRDPEPHPGLRQPGNSTDPGLIR